MTRYLFGFSAFIFINITYGSVVTDTLPISTIVSANCTLSSASLNFGRYNPIGENRSSPLDALTTFQISCTKGANITITMNNGLHAGNAEGTRAMSDGSGNYLGYELYTNPGRSAIWSDTNPLSYVSSSSTVRTQTVYGRIQGGQNKPAGNYTDTVTITATF
jgi:spore coat protein U-like protein